MPLRLGILFQRASSHLIQNVWLLCLPISLMLKELMQKLTQMIETSRGDKLLNTLLAMRFMIHGTGKAYGL